MHSKNSLLLLIISGQMLKSKAVGFLTENLLGSQARTQSGCPGWCLYRYWIGQGFQQLVVSRKNETCFSKMEIVPDALLSVLVHFAWGPEILALIWDKQLCEN